MRFDDRVTGNIKTYALQRQEDSHRHRSVGDQQERHGRRRDRGRPARSAEGSARRGGAGDHEPWLKYIGSMKGDVRRPRHSGAARQRPPVCAARHQRHLAHHRRQGHRRDRRRPAPDVGSAVLPSRSAAHAHHLGRSRDDGLRVAGGDRRQDGAARTRRCGRSSATAASR